MDIGLVTRIQELVVATAISCIGKGEEGGNNQGRFIVETLGGKPGYEWCALLAGYCYRQAFRAGQPRGVTPSWLFRHASTPEPGANRLWTGLARVGASFDDPMTAVPGDLLLWKRIGGHHVAILEEVDAGGLCHTIEGNVGKFPSRTKRLIHDVERELKFVGFATLRTRKQLEGGK